jgi:hypothetical protein
MRRWILVATAVFALAAPAVAAAPKTFKASVTAPTHAPKINIHWPYQVTVTDLKGKPLAATLSLVVVDPVGGVHPVQYSYSKTKNVTNVPIKGTFRDYIIWPPASAVGLALKFRATLKTAKGKAVLIYLVTPHR